MLSITPEEIALLSKYVNEITGIKLDPQKGYLLESRFQPLISEYQCTSYRDLYQKARSDQTGALMNQMIDAITTNETYFFRDSKPFELLSNKIIPDLIDRRRQETGSDQIPLKIWSAACSTGQEIYSIGITLLEMFGNNQPVNISILGTDISDEVVAKASYGQYNRFEVERGLPPQYLNRYFTKTANGWRIKDIVRSMARFEKRDLNGSFSDLGRFDIVFCRNVAIYFDNRDKISLFRKIKQVLLPGGSLIVGASESLSGIATDFVARHYLKSMYYQLKDDAGIDQSIKRQTFPTPPARPSPRPATPIAKPAPAARVKPRPNPKRDIGNTTDHAPPVQTPALKTRPTPPAPVLKKSPSIQAESPGRSLLASIQQSSREKRSLLSGIKSSAEKSKKSLLNDLKEDSKDHKQ